MEKLHTKDVDELMRGVLTLKTVDECYRFFEDVCTVKEIVDMAQRLKTAKMLSAGHNYVEVNKKTGASSATISRVSKCLEYGDGGYRTVIERLSEAEENPAARSEASGFGNADGVSGKKQGDN